jgi:hypothetical protein
LQAMPGTGSTCKVFVYFTTRGLGPSIFVDLKSCYYSIVYFINISKQSQTKNY